MFSRALGPTLAMYVLRVKHASSRSRNPLALFQRWFERVFERIRSSYRGILSTLVRRRVIFIPSFLAACFAVFLLTPWLGQDFFPNTDSGRFILHVRARTGTRIEETARFCDLVKPSIPQPVPPPQ